MANDERAPPNGHKNNPHTQGNGYNGHYPGKRIPEPESQKEKDCLSRAGGETSGDDQGKATAMSGRAPFTVMGIPVLAPSISVPEKVNHTANEQGSRQYKQKSARKLGNQLCRPAYIEGGKPCTHSRQDKKQTENRNRVTRGRGTRYCSNGSRAPSLGQKITRYERFLMAGTQCMEYSVDERRKGEQHRFHGATACAQIIAYAIPK